ncbi:MAG: HD domain-containing protein [Coriobacteriales bacterium]|jgi:dGTPase|nr:HD domain-containing protein [Coriobacteriales bacterium]
MTQPRYKQLSPELVARIESDRAVHRSNPCCATDAHAIRRRQKRDKPSLWRPAYVRDIEKILHSPWYNRYADKTQVFSLYKNDDLTRRALHVQIVSRVARNIGAALGLNTDLIEAIALGHDIGHTPFGHSGERFLSKLIHERTGRFFNHNVQSVRVLDTIFMRNISLPCLSGILCHNGEFGQQEYRPQELADFREYDKLVESCYLHKEVTEHLVPSTLEGCVVRICDMIAYVGKDRQDAARICDDPLDDAYEQRAVGQSNAQIINNISVDIIENSYGKDHIRLSNTVFKELEHIKRENYELIYDNGDVNKTSARALEAMFARLYERLYSDLTRGDAQSYIYRHHINNVRKQRNYYGAATDYADEEPNQIVVDYLASMTDDYFVDLHEHYFPGEEQITYIPYFKG